MYYCIILIQISLKRLILIFFYKKLPVSGFQYHRLYISRIKAFPNQIFPVSMVSALSEVSSIRHVEKAWQLSSDCRMCVILLLLRFFKQIDREIVCKNIQNRHSSVLKQNWEKSRKGWGSWEKIPISCWELGKPRLSHFLRNVLITIHFLPPSKKKSKNTLIGLLNAKMPF